MKTIRHTFEEYISPTTRFDPVPDYMLDSAVVVVVVVVFDSAVVGTMVMTFDSVAGMVHCIAADVEPCLVFFVLHACCFFKVIFAEDCALLCWGREGGE